ncbi:MAG: PHP domain-containing protein [Actinobacteria bacterium]|nr:MAG: PHP domain-containing protein [Actinomycetota bacterium]REK38745.1 MAG: PHP domain-containing protein [Actinomycetota bacterium]
MAVDLHSHSTYSDGSDTPAELVSRARERGLTAVALTDHDTLEGVEEATAAADGIEVIPGTELSLQRLEGGMHLVVLWLSPGRGPLQDRLAELQYARGSRNQLIVDELTRLGMPITLDEILVEAGDGSVGRPHIAAVMVRKGYVPDIKTAFDLWLANGAPAYVKRRLLTPEEGIGLAIESGAVPVLAHPHTLGINRAVEMADILDELKSYGLIGLEAHYSTYHQHERDGYADLARRFGLLASGGSDYHGTYKQGIELGSGHGDLAVPESLLEALRERRQ